METNGILEIMRKTNELLSQLIRYISNSIFLSNKVVEQPVNNLIVNALVDGREEYLNILRERKNEEKKGKGIFSGFAQLDEIINGFIQGELVVIGGRPGIGKTSLIMPMILNHLKKHIPVAIYSLELAREAIIDRLVSIRNRIPITQLKTGKLTDKEYEKVEKTLLELSKSSLYFVGGASFTSDGFSNALNSLIEEKGIRILYIDYLQLMISNHPRRNREQEISDLMRMLKSLALRYRIPIILTSQMNRSVEWRGGTKRPLLSDLRESGSIEEIADKVLLIYRAEMHGITLDEEGNSTDGKAEIIVAKNRMGSTGDLVLLFNKNFGLFENINWDKKVFPSLKLPDNPFSEGIF
jgi:replicative DNA helicase